MKQLTRNLKNNYISFFQSKSEIAQKILQKHRLYSPQSYVDSSLQWKRKCQKIQQSNQIIRNSYQQIQNHYIALTNQFNALKDDIKNKDKKIRELEQNIVRNKYEQNQQIINIKKFEEMLKQLQNQIQNLNKKVNRGKQLVKQKDLQIKYLKNININLEREKNKLESQMKDYIMPFIPLKKIQFKQTNNYFQNPLTSQRIKCRQNVSILTDRSRCNSYHRKQLEYIVKELISLFRGQLQSLKLYFNQQIEKFKQLFLNKCIGIQQRFQKSVQL